MIGAKNDQNVKFYRMIRESRIGSGYPIRDFQVGDPKLEAEERTARLREAVKRAGRAPAVADRSGVPYATLNKYLAGRDMPTINLIAIARACGVSVEWLATGAEPGTPVIPAISAPDRTDAPSIERPASSRLFNTVNIDKLAEAIEAVLEQLARNNVTRPWHQILRAAILVYDLMQEPDDAEISTKESIPARYDEGKNNV